MTVTTQKKTYRTHTSGEIIRSLCIMVNGNEHLIHSETMADLERAHNLSYKPFAI